MAKSRPGTHQLKARDKATGVRACVDVIPGPNGREVRRLCIEAPPDRGLLMQDLSVLAAFGMRLPDELATAAPSALPAPPAGQPVVSDPGPVQTEIAVDPPARAPVKATPRGRGAQPGSKRQAYRLMPALDVLTAAYDAAGGNQAVMATTMGVPRHTVAGWVRRARKLGAELGARRGET